MSHIFPILLCHRLQVGNSPNSRNKTQNQRFPPAFHKYIFRLIFSHWRSTAAEEIEGSMWSRISHGTYFRGYYGVSRFCVMDTIPTYEFRTFDAGLRTGLTTRHLDVVIVRRSAVATTGHQWTWETWKVQNLIKKCIKMNYRKILSDDQWCWAIFFVQVFSFLKYIYGQEPLASRKKQIP